MLTDQQFERTRQLALRLAGIELVERHRELLGRRSRRLGICEEAGVDSLLNAAEQGEPSATQRLLCLLTTKFTGFFRYPLHFDLAAHHAIHAVDRRGRARLWSAGTATGEEAYSLAMVLIETFQRDDPPATVLATDVEAEALETARQGEYRAAALQMLSPARRVGFFRDTSVPQRWCVAPAVRCLVEFRTLNLVGEDWSIEGPFDVVLCRNVLMYLETRYRHAVLKRLASLLAADGLLMLDPAEHVGQAARFFQAGANGVYSLRHEPSHSETGHFRTTRLTV